MDEVLRGGWIGRDDRGNESLGVAQGHQDFDDSGRLRGSEARGQEQGRGVLHDGGVVLVIGKRVTGEKPEEESAKVGVEISDGNLNEWMTTQ
jgi:hypothetical protein